MTLALILLGGTLCVILAGVAYLTLSVNAEANHQDRVSSVPPVATGLPAFLRSLQGAAGQSLSQGSDVALYQNGDEIFPPMLEAIRTSQQTVHFATYVYWAGAIPDRFAMAFSDAARRGVTVRIILDREGAKRISRTIVRQLREAGCTVAWFRRALWYDWTKYNRRTHRRLLIVDGTIAFTGGVGIADEWSGYAQSPAHWRDTHVRVTGPIVGALQGAFTDSWNQCTDELLLDARDYPELAPTGNIPVCAVVSTPATGASAAQRVYASCVAGAARTLYVTNAYFVPTPAFVDALCAARARGVDVKIIVPGPYHNQPMVRRASRHSWPKLLAGGVAIYEYQPTMIHAKTIVVDGEILLVGSINFDPRSFALNAECGVIIASQPLATHSERVFAADLAVSQKITPDVLTSRSIVTRAGDAVCYWWRAQL